MVGEATYVEAWVFADSVFSDSVFSDSAARCLQHLVAAPRRFVTGRASGFPSRSEPGDTRIHIPTLFRQPFSSRWLSKGS